MHCPGEQLIGTYEELLREANRQPLDASPWRPLPPPTRALTKRPIPA